MKIENEKINKYQAGGQFAVYQPLPLVPNTPPVPQMPAGNQATQSEGGLDKELVKKLMGEGIANDVMAFSNQVNQAYEQYSGLSEFERGTIKGRQLRDMMKGDLGQLNLLMRNKKEFDQSIENVKSQNAYGEMAITARGIVVKNLKTGKLSEISHEEYAKDIHSNERNFQAMTNAELINEREYNQNLVNDTNSINALNSSIGMENVKTEVTKILSNLGSDDAKNSREYFVDSTESGSMKQAVRQLVGMSKDGIYSIAEMSANGSNERQLKAAAQSMWQNLSNNAKSLLRARAVTNGAQGDEIEEKALGYALSLLNPASKTSKEASVKVSYDAGLNKEPGGDKDATADYGYWQSLASQAGSKDKLVIDSGSGDQLEAWGSNSGPLQSGGNILSKTSLRNVPELQGAANFNNIYFGENKIDANFVDAIVYDGGDVMNVSLPTTRDTNGGNKPDFEAMPKFNATMKKLNGVTNMMARQKIIESEGFSMAQDGSINVPTANFVVFKGMTNDAALGTGDYKSTYLKTVGANEEKEYERAYRYNGDSPDKKGADRAPDEYSWKLLNPTTWFNSVDVLKGLVFIEAKQNVANSRFLDNQKITTKKSNTTLESLDRVNGLQNLNQGRNNANGVINEFILK